MIVASPVRIDALISPAGALVLAATTFTLEVNAPTADGPMTINRTSELTFAPTGEDEFVVVAYRVDVTRETPEASTSTTVERGG